MSLHQIEPLRFALEILEGFPCFPVGTPGIVQTSLPSLLVLVDDGFSFCGLRHVAVVEGEVAGIHREGMLLVAYVDFHAAETQVLARFSMCGEGFQRVFLLFGGQSIESILEQHIGIERIVLGHDGLLVVAVVEREIDSCFLRKQTSQFHVGRYGIVVGVFIGTAQNVLLDTTKSCSLYVSCHVY